MRYTFFANTPAHVHLYKHAIKRLVEADNEVVVYGREYDCTKKLLDYYELPYLIYGACGTSKLSLFRELPNHFANIAREIRRFRPDLIFGMGAYSAFAGVVARTPTVLILDSEPTGFDHAISRPFARAILTPSAFSKDLGENHYRFRGYKECAYLHPDVFEPDADVRAALVTSPDERFAIVRFNAFGSHHDIGKYGFSREEQARLIEHLANLVTVFVSSEGDDIALDHPNVRRYDLHPARIHDVLSEASLLVADSQTMVTEAALLGTPAIRSNSFVGQKDMGNFLELERHGLLRNVQSFEDVLRTSTELLTDDTVPTRWRQRSDAYMSDLVNLSEIIVDVARNPESVSATPGLSRHRSHPNIRVERDDPMWQ